MTKTLPASVGPAHQPFRRPGVGRAFGERPGPAASFRESQHRQHPPEVAAHPGQAQMGVRNGTEWESVGLVDDPGEAKTLLYPPQPVEQKAAERDRPALGKGRGRHRKPTPAEDREQ